MALVLDTGPILALLNADDVHHSRCVELVDELSESLVVPEADVVRAAELEDRYADLGLGFVDTAVVAVCERLGEPKVATLDRRDLSVVVPRHVPALELVPDPVALSRRQRPSGDDIDGPPELEMFGGRNDAACALGLASPVRRRGEDVQRGSGGSPRRRDPLRESPAPATSAAPARPRPAHMMYVFCCLGGKRAARE